jgi:hypothetical protein
MLASLAERAKATIDEALGRWSADVDRRRALFTDRMDEGPGSEAARQARARSGASTNPKATSYKARGRISQKQACFC